MSTTTRNGSGEIPGTRPTTTRDSRRRDGVPKPPPAYRRRKGYKQAIVTFTDVHTKKRRDYWLGPYGSPESRELYYRLIAEWEASDRRLPRTPVSSMSGAAVLTIAEVIRDAEVILYGSRARGEAQKYSDYDLLVLVDEPVNIDLKEKILDQVYPVQLETGRMISFIVYNKQQWRSPLYRAMPLHKNIDREGIVL